MNTPRECSGHSQQELALWAWVYWDSHSSAGPERRSATAKIMPHVSKNVSRWLRLAGAVGFPSGERRLVCLLVAVADVNAGADCVRYRGQSGRGVRQVTTLSSNRLGIPRASLSGPAGAVASDSKCQVSAQNHCRATGGPLGCRIACLATANTLLGGNNSLLARLGNSLEMCFGVTFFSVRRGLCGPKYADSLKNSLFAGKTTGDGCDRHCVASHAVLRLAIVCNLRLTGPEISAFLAFDFVSRLPISQPRGRNGRKSPALFPHIPVWQRLSPETGLITTAARGVSENSHCGRRWLASV
jgi:hypothetical protein